MSLKFRTPKPLLAVDRFRGQCTSRYQDIHPWLLVPPDNNPRANAKCIQCEAVFEKTYATTQNYVKSHVFWILKKT